MKNPYFELHKEFREAGARVLISSGQACVLYGIAAFSKDGDWIIEESEKSCDAVRTVLAAKNASYRLGAPLDPQWLKNGWTSHFEYRDGELRVRVDFCSRPPRVADIKELWNNAIRKHDVELVDVQDLIMLKQTRRTRDYAVIGALAEAIGLQGNIPEVAIAYLQDYTLLNNAVHRWPSIAAKSSRQAVRLIVAGATRADIVNALAQEQDSLISSDQARIDQMLSATADYQQQFAELSRQWKASSALLDCQHLELKSIAHQFLHGSFHG